MNKHLLVHALMAAGLAPAANMPTHGVVTEHKYHLDRLNPRLKGTPPNPNRKTKAEKKRDRKEKQRASAAERQARKEPPVASARRTET